MGPLYKLGHRVIDKPANQTVNRQAERSARPNASQSNGEKQSLSNGFRVFQMNYAKALPQIRACELVLPVASCQVAFSNYCSS